jgi:hypothetical protein
MSGTLRIDEQLNIILPLDRANGTVVWVHAAPISREVFQKYWLVLSKAFAGIYGEGLGSVAAPRIAALMLRRVSEAMEVNREGTINEWNAPDGVQQGLMPEIRRMANVAAMASNGAGRGWQLFTLEHAIAHHMIDEEDLDEVDGLLVFFTLVWRLHLRKDRRTVVDGGVRLWGASTTLQSLSAFAASLPTSTETASTGEKPPAPSSPPVSTGPVAPASRNVSVRPPTISPGGPPTNIVNAH